MLDFFARQQQARLNTARLLPYLCVSIALTTLLLYGLCIGTYAVVVPFVDFWWSFLGAVGSQDVPVRFLQRVWIPELFWGIAASTIALVIGATIRKFIQLRKGGWFVAIELGGIRVDPQTEDRDE